MGAEVKVQQWRVSELAFPASQEHAQPFVLDLSASFTGPRGESRVIRGFWDGGRTWKLRFTPTAAGKWMYRTTCKSDRALDGQTGVLDVAPASGKNPLLRHGPFLRVGKDGHHLTYSDGTPFFWLGDTSWFAPSDLVPFEGSSNPKYPSMFQALIDKRKVQGFTVLQVGFLGPKKGVGGVFAAPADWKPEAVDYWRDVDRYVAYANDAGIVLSIGVGWSNWIETADLDAVLKPVWRDLVARYGSRGVTWHVCGEYNRKNVPETVAKALALGAFIKEIDPYPRAMSIHPWYFRREKRQSWGQPWCDFIMLQGAHKCSAPTDIYLKPYRLAKPKPVLESECNYEGIHDLTDADVRWAAYRAIQSGSFGYTYGAHGLWNASQSAEDQRGANWGTIMPWWLALERPGGGQMRHLRTCYESVEWWKLAPAPDAVEPEGGQRIHTKADGDRTFLIYFERGLGRTAKATLRGGNAKRAYSARWFNPRDGKTKAAAAIAMPNGQSTLPDRPDNGDWVLIISVAEKTR